MLKVIVQFLSESKSTNFSGLRCRICLRRAFHTAYHLPSTAYCLPPTAYCLLSLLRSAKKTQIFLQSEAVNDIEAEHARVIAQPCLWNGRLVSDEYPEI